MPPGVPPAASGVPPGVPPAASGVPPGVPPAASDVPPGVLRTKRYRARQDATKPHRAERNLAVVYVRKAHITHGEYDINVRTASRWQDPISH